MKKFLIPFCTVFIAAQISIAAIPVFQEKESPNRKRVKRPAFDKSDSVYFKNLFSEGLIGDRPARGTGRKIAKSTNVQNPNTENASTGNSAVASGWEKLVSAEDLQSELKNLSISLSQVVSSPGKFKSGGNREVRQIASMIAVMFGVIAEYKGEVKWKGFAKEARDAFAQCAQSSSTTSTQAFQQAKNRKEDLQQILGGGPFEAPIKANPDFEWSSVADVSELMKRLKTSYREKIKPWVSSEADYRKNNRDLMREAAIVAVIAEVLKKESMENADNDDYVEFSNSLRDGALMILNSKTTMDQSMATKGAGMMDQSCQACHGEYN